MSTAPQSEARGVAWTLKLRTFAGVVFGASHYMPALTGRVEDVTVAYVLTTTDARALSKPDFAWHAGDWSEAFLSRKDALAASIAVFAHLAGERDVLICEDEKDEVLAGPDDLIAAGTAAATDEGAWWDWKESFTPHEHDARYGHGAPPSVRIPSTVIVRRDGDGWTVDHTLGKGEF